MRLSGSLAKTINNAQRQLTLREKFMLDVMRAIEKLDQKHRRISSPYYKPSSLNCKRLMYYMRIQAPADKERTMYTMVGMADTGTRRHIAIQETLEAMEGLGFDWRYIDVAKYLEEKHSQGKCLDVQATDKRGMETHLLHTVLNMSFMCDGIIQQISTGNYYLFEFKNQTSYKYADKIKVDDAHLLQVTAYCLALDLEYALVLYENRNTCELTCPEVLYIGEESKQQMVERLLEVEQCVQDGTPPQKLDNDKVCRWCSYKTTCQKGN